ncbi:MAG: hypothetical protein U0411_08735 [Thermodesulfovibrionales bacterium]
MEVAPTAESLVIAGPPAAAVSVAAANPSSFSAVVSAAPQVKSMGPAVLLTIEKRLLGGATV